MIASIIGSGINGNCQLQEWDRETQTQSLLLLEVELMETLVMIKSSAPPLAWIASIIGSGINGNCSSKLTSLFKLSCIASIIGSGINGNFTLTTSNVYLIGYRFYYWKWN